jgi:hypothetical protein
MISSAVLVQVSGLRAWFKFLAQARISAPRGCTRLWAPRRIIWPLRKPNQRSALLIRKDPVGVKWERG